jgi:Flp pilus assembly protein TadG
MTGHQAGSGRARRISWSLPRSRRAERGATLVEMALVLPILLLIIIGITEIGLYFKNYLTISYASREGARVGAFVGDSVDADCQILVALGELIGTANLDRLEKIEIFIADQDGTQTFSKTNTATLKDGGDPTACTEPSAPSDGWFRSTNYPAANRNVTVAVDEPPLDIIGVRIYFTHEWATGFPPFSGEATIDESNINRLEPEVFE